MPSVLVSVEAGVATITLNRPGKLNALNPERHQLLRAALARARDEPAIRAVLLTAAGRGFCTGQDLGERDVSAGAPALDLSVSLGWHYNPLVRRMRALPKPIVCAVNGVAAGAGASIALACDLVIAARSASFIQSFSKIGLVPDAGGSYFLPRLVGAARAMGLALLAEKLSAEQAAQWGLIWKVVDDAVHRRSARARGQARQRTDPGLWPAQEGDLRVRWQFIRCAARPRARPAARGRTDRGLPRGRKRVQGEAPGALQGQMNKQALAEEILRRFAPLDHASRLLGMHLLEGRAGHVRMSMRVTEAMRNAQQICHGGLIFTLADTSFGYASNSHNQRAVAASCSIEFLAPAQVGDELTAEASEVAHSGRTRIYDVRVTNQREEMIAVFRGKSTTVKGTWIE